MAALKAARAVASEPAAPIEVPAAVRWQQVGLIALAVAAAYGRTLAVPFYLDDFSSIRENDLISHWQGWAPLWQFNPRRVIAYLTFALDYRLGRFDPAGYHVVNTLIHFAAGLASYALAAGIVRTPRVAGTSSGCGSLVPARRVAPVRPASAPHRGGHVRRATARVTGRAVLLLGARRVRTGTPRCHGSFTRMVVGRLRRGHAPRVPLEGECRHAAAGGRPDRSGVLHPEPQATSC